MKRAYGYVSRLKFRDSEDEGINDKFHVRISGVGKPNTSDHPYLIANEWISACLAEFLRLPVPPFAIMEKRNARTRMFVTIRFDGTSPVAGVTPLALWQVNPRLTCGITLFDILIANVDRHTNNIKVDRRDKPARVHLFDHDRCLFYCQAGRGCNWLDTHETDPSIGPYHCLPPVITTADHFKEWANRIRDIPGWFIADVCREVRGIGIKKVEVDRVERFLVYRRDNIGNLLTAARPLFPLVTAWPLIV